MRARPRSRTALAALSALASLALVLAACGDDGGGASPTGGATGSGAATASTVKLGAVITLSGPLAQIGQSHLAGAKLAVDEVNKAGGADGHKFELVTKDEKVDPQATVQAVRELLGADIKLMLGLTTDSDCLAAAPLVSNGGGIRVGTSCQSNLLQGDKFVPGFFEIAPTNYMLSKATARLANDKFPQVKTWDGIGPDYEFGHEVWQSFQDGLKELDPGVTFRKNVFVPLTETQFNSYITSLLSGLPADSAEKNGLFMSTFSATTVGLAKQGKSHNLFGRYKVALNLGGSTPTAEALGADTPPLWFIYDYYDGAYDNPTNTKFVADFKAANGGKVPNAWAYEGYTAVMAYKAAIEKAKSTDAKKLIDTMAGMSFDTPKGELTFRKEDHLLQSPVTVWQVVGDAASPGGFKVTSAEAIPADEVLPPVSNK
jgi:branched-chain amino acid transport system substrate-binding protein